MLRFLDKHAGKLKFTALVLMLLIPLFLYLAALYGSAVQVKLLLGLIGATMLLTMRIG